MNKRLIGHIMFWFGFGVLFHDYLHTEWLVGRYSEILSLQGGYFGSLIMFIGWYIISEVDIQILKSKIRKIKGDDKL